jgi:hypothetical protein
VVGLPVTRLVDSTLGVHAMVSKGSFVDHRYEAENVLVL